MGKKKVVAHPSLDRAIPLSSSENPLKRKLKTKDRFIQSAHSNSIKKENLGRLSVKKNNEEKMGREKKVLKIPCIFSPASGGSGGFIIYFHSNGEDVKECIPIYEYLAEKLGVEILLIHSSMSLELNTLDMEFMLENLQKQQSSKILLQSMTTLQLY